MNSNQSFPFHPESDKDLDELMLSPSNSIGANYTDAEVARAMQATGIRFTDQVGSDFRNS